MVVRSYVRKTDNKHPLLQLVTSVALRSVILISDEIDRVDRKAKKQQLNQQKQPKLQSHTSILIYKEQVYKFT